MKKKKIQAILIFITRNFKHNNFETSAKHQNVVDHPQPVQKQQFRDMPINITSSIGDLERCNQNQNSRNEALSSLQDQDPNHHQQRRSNFRHTQKHIQEMES